MKLFCNVMEDYGFLISIFLIILFALVLIFFKVINLPKEFFEIEKNQWIIGCIEVGGTSLLGMIGRKIYKKRKNNIYYAKYEKNNYLEDVKNFNLYVNILYIFYPKLDSKIFSNYLFFKLSQIKKFKIEHSNEMAINKDIEYEFTKDNYWDKKNYDKCNFLIEDTYIIDNILNPEMLTLKIGRVLLKKERDRLNSQKMNTLFQEAKAFIIKNKIREIYLYSTMSTYNREYFYKNFMDDRDLKELNPNLIIYNINKCGIEFKRMEAISIK